MNVSSYTAASAFPAKLFCELDDGTELVRLIREHRIPPLHVQINPTNNCPLNCSFCSCKNMDRTAEMPLAELIEISAKLIRLGARAFTITGGGDPLAHKHITKYVKWLFDQEIEISLVTNGVLFNKHDIKFTKMLTWCRISLSDERLLRPAELEGVVESQEHNWCDFSFSYVVQAGDLGRLIPAIQFANKHCFGHIRVVDDIIGGSAVSLESIRDTLVKHGIDTSRVIWQGRKTYSRGHKRCLVGLLKPNIDVYGNLTPCCGIQYASNPPMLDFTRAFRVCDKDGIEKVYREQRCFDGSVCERCYYSDYNNALNAMWGASELKHQRFL